MRMSALLPPSCLFVARRNKKTKQGLERLLTTVFTVVAVPIVIEIEKVGIKAKPKSTSLKRSGASLDNS